MSQEEKRPLLAQDSGRPPLLDGYQTTGGAPSVNVSASAVVNGVEEVHSVPALVESSQGAGSVETVGAPASVSAVIPCRVCGEVLDIRDPSEPHVIKCNQCKEATPVRSAPPGKKYVRCSCNCLLICRTSSQRIACPRANCKRVIILPGAQGPGAQRGPRVGSAPPTVPGMCRVTCCYCRDSFLFNSLNNALARCPHCRKVSSVGRRYARARGTGFLVTSLIVLLIGIGVTAGTFHYSHLHQGMYILYVGAFLCALLLFLRAVYYFTLGISESDSSSDQEDDSPSTAGP